MVKKYVDEAIQTQFNENNVTFKLNIIKEISPVFKLLCFLTTLNYF
mgnify:CR=1 FL=1